MEFIQDLLAAIGVVLNGIPQGLLAMSIGFAAMPTALGFGVGAIACLLTGSVVPISFQAESIVMVKNSGKTIKERISIVLFSGILLFLVGILGISTYITGIAGEVVLNAMMVGVGFLLVKLAFDMVKENQLVGLVSIATATFVYLFLGKNLVYTIVISLILSSVISKLVKKNNDSIIPSEEVKFSIVKPMCNFNVIRGTLSLTCLTIGTNIAFGSITTGLASTELNPDLLAIYVGIADSISALFGGGPVESIISATASAPNPTNSGVIMMVIMAVILFMGLLPKIGKYIENQAIAGFLFVLGVFITVPNNAIVAFSGTKPGDSIVAGVTMGVTAFSDPFIGMLCGIILKFLFSIGIGI